MKVHAHFTAALISLGGAVSGQAQGIPVFDAANLVQAVQQVVDGVTQINNQVQQIAQMQLHLDSITGVRNLGRISDSPALRNYVPPQAYALLNAIDRSGDAGLTDTAKALRAAGMLYNCMDRAEGPKAACQARLSQPYQVKGLLQDAMNAAAARLPQVDALMDAINATTDQKSILELQARIATENVLLAHEASQIQLLQAMAASDERIARSRERERQYEALGRTGKIADYLH